MLETCDEVLELRREDLQAVEFERNKRFDREVEKFQRWMTDHEGLALNTARTQSLGIKQLFKFYGMPVTVEAIKTVPTTKDYIPSIEEFRRAYNVADLQTRLIISMGLDLGWRIGDFLEIRKDRLPNLNKEPPIPIEKITEKEKEISKTFFSDETVSLLQTYLKTVEDKPNPYLFGSNGKGYLKPEAINYKLRQAFQKAKIKIPKGKRLRFHCFRKRIYSTCADLGISPYIADLMVGKSVDHSKLPYLGEVQHKTAFIRFRQKLRLTNGNLARMDKDLKLEEVELVVKTFLDLFKDQLTPLIVQKLKEEGKLKTLPASERKQLETKAITNAYDLMLRIAQLEKEKHAEEYKKRLEENNCNNHQL